MAKAATQTKTTKKDLSFAQRAEQHLAEANQWQTVEAETKYIGSNMQKCLGELGDAIFPGNRESSSMYQEAIIASLVETISPEIGVLDFWKAIGKDGCSKVKIEQGHMNFYDSKNKLIDITKYTQSIEFYANSSFYDERMKERIAKIEEAKRQLAELMNEISTNN